MGSSTHHPLDFIYCACTCHADGANWHRCVHGVIAVAQRRFRSNPAILLSAGALGDKSTVRASPVPGVSTFGFPTKMPLFPRSKLRRTDCASKYSRSCFMRWSNWWGLDEIVTINHAHMFPANSPSWYSHPRPRPTHAWT